MFTVFSTNSKGQQDIVGQFPSLKEANAAMQQCLLCSKQTHYGIVSADGVLVMLVSGRFKKVRR